MDAREGTDVSDISREPMSSMAMPSTNAAVPHSGGFRLHSELDALALSKMYSVHRRLQIGALLDDESADRLHRHLASDMEWTLLLAAHRRTYHVAPRREGQQIMDDPRLLAHVYRAATDGFAFAYATHRRVGTPETDAGDMPNTVLAEFFDFLNAPAFLSFARALTGNPNLRRASAQATCFLAGHFLNFHTDYDGGKKKIAYVLNLSQGWQAQWGGLLQFADEHGVVTECFVPSYNSLSIFTVPQWHAVSFVTPFAGNPRYAVSGWLHEE